MLTRYDGSPAHDLALAQWWAMLVHGDELGSVLPARYAPLGAFLGVFRGGGRTYLAVDDHGPAVVVFGFPWCSAAMLGCWLRRDWRRTRRGHEAARAGIRELLAWSPLLMVLAPDEPRRRLYARVGVRFLDGWVPGLWQGQAACLGWLTAETYRPVPWQNRTREAVTHGRG